jgi:crotonobetainyl-CoA:carnitine CoA-transferase CaiB-like acyl-CoA transferase
MSLPLKGLTVVELARSLAGPLAGMMLAELGARVIKVEPPGGDETRGWGPPFVGELSTYFISANRGKESVVLDLKSREGRAILRRLLARADVVIENFLPSTARRLGLQVPRRCIHCTISGYGPGVEKPAYDLIIQAESGAMRLNGDPKGPPMKIGITLADVLAAHDAVRGILSMRLARRTGRLNISLLHSMLAGFTHHAQSYLSTGRVPPRHGNDHPSLYPYGVFKAADGYVAIGVANEKQWEGFCRALNLPHLIERYPSNRRRVESRRRLGRIIGKRLKNRRCRALASRMAKHGVPFGRVQHLGQAFLMIDGSNGGRAPKLGEHTETVLQWLKAKG